MASVKDSFRPSATAIERPIWATWSVWVSLVTKWSLPGSMKTWVLRASRRKALEWTMRSRSRSNAVRQRVGLLRTLPALGLGSLGGGGCQPQVFGVLSSLAGNVPEGFRMDDHTPTIARPARLPDRAG